MIAYLHNIKPQKHLLKSVIILSLNNVMSDVYLG